MSSLAPSPSLSLIPEEATTAERTLRNAGGLPPGSAAITRVRKLFLPYGGLPRGLRVSHGLPGECGLVFHWFCVRRPEPVAAYESLILNHKGLTPAVRSRAEAMVDEMFTEEEFGLLRDYLYRRHNEDTRTAVLTTPLPSLRVEGVTRAAAQRPFLGADPADSDALRGGAALCADGFYRLSDEEGCDLPFRVWGFYAAAAPHGRAENPFAAAAAAAAAPAEGEPTQEGQAEDGPGLVLRRDRAGAR